MRLIIMLFATAFIAIAFYLVIINDFKYATLFSVLTNGCLIILVDTNYETKN